MTGRLLLVLVLLVIQLVDSGADPIPEPCHKAEMRDSPVWKLLCEQLLKSLGSNDATGNENALKAGADGAERQTELEKPVVDVVVLDDSTPQESNSVNSRQHKAFFVDYPASQRVYQQNKSSSVRKKHQQQQQRKKQAGKSKNKKPESEIFFIRLPPTPYSYVPGLGYISQPPSFSTASLAGSAAKPQRNPFIKLPIDFVSNGKPTAVYRWPPTAPPSSSKQKPSKTHRPKYKPDSPIIKLNRGPYVFDGRPKSVYLMKRNPTRPNRF